MCGQKRRRGAVEEEHSAIATPPLPRKKALRRRQSQQETNTAYWDSLSKLWLTRRALDKLARRNRRRASPVRTTVARDLDLCDEPDLLKNLSKQFKRFVRHGGPDLRDLTGVSLIPKRSKSLLISSFQYRVPPTANSTAHIMPSKQSSSRTQSGSRNTLGDSTARTTTSKTRKTSPYDPNFEQNLIDILTIAFILMIMTLSDPSRPNNENEILDKLGRPRASLSPSQFPEKEFRSFKEKNSRALNEDDVKIDVFPMIQGNVRIPSARNLVFGNLEPLPHGNLVVAKPDFYIVSRISRIALLFKVCRVTVLVTVALFRVSLVEQRCFLNNIPS